MCLDSLILICISVLTLLMWHQRALESTHQLVVMLSVCVRVCVAVRTGNLANFNQVLDQFGEKFQTDGTYTLIIRLRHNVIKTGETGEHTKRWVDGCFQIVLVFSDNVGGKTDQVYYVCVCGRCEDD